MINLERKIYVINCQARVYCCEWLTELSITNHSSLRALDNWFALIALIFRSKIKDLCPYIIKYVNMSDDLNKNEDVRYTCKQVSV